jgi:hypothetical protein
MPVNLRLQCPLDASLGGSWLPMTQEPLPRATLNSRASSFPANVLAVVCAETNNSPTPPSPSASPVNWVPIQEVLLLAYCSAHQRWDLRPEALEQQMASIRRGCGQSWRSFEHACVSPDGRRGPHHRNSWHFTQEFR